MAFCKVCVCGEKIVFEKRLSFPDNCPTCGRRTVSYLTYQEDDPNVEELINQVKGQVVDTNDDETNDSDNNFQIGISDSQPPKKKYVLKAADGYEIPIPDEGGIIGRSELGADYLAEYPSVSRKHIRVMPRRNLGVIVEDLSSYGTIIDGQRLEKNTPTRAVANSRITLYTVEFILAEKECSIL